MDLTKLTNALQTLEAATDAMTSAVYELDSAIEGRVLLDDLGLDLRTVPAIRETLRQVPESLRGLPVGASPWLVDREAALVAAIS